MWDISTPNTLNITPQSDESSKSVVVTDSPTPTLKGSEDNNSASAPNTSKTSATAPFSPNVPVPFLDGPASSHSAATAGSVAIKPHETSGIRCPTCGNEMNNRAALNKHVNQVHKKRIWCDMPGCEHPPFGTKGDLNKHKGTAHREFFPSRAMTCPFANCGVTVHGREDDFKRHLQKQHQLGKDEIEHSMIAREVSQEKCNGHKLRYDGARGVDGLVIPMIEKGTTVRGKATRRKGHDYYIYCYTLKSYKLFHGRFDDTFSSITENLSTVLILCMF